jgi:enoyl-CoA hydratase/carnithine racemase
MSAVELSWPAQHIAQLTIDNGPRNFSDWKLQEDLEQALAMARTAEARVVILASAVEGYFVAHGSIRSLLDTFVDDRPSCDPMASLRVQKELETGPMVSIAAVDGQAWGGGAELALACDLRVVSRQATFAFHEVRVGTTPAGGAVRVTWLVGAAAAKRLLLDGRPIPGEEAHRLGLADRLVDPGDATAEAVRWAQWLVTNPPGSLARAKEAVARVRDLPYREALRQETTGFIERFADADFVDRIREVQRRYDRGADSYEAFDL